MFKIHTKNHFIIKIVSLFAVITSIVGLSVFAFEHIQKDADAASGSVYVYQGGVISYGGWGTHYYTVSSGGGAYTAYCANPSLSGYSGSFTSYTMNNDNVKLMTYIGSVDTTATWNAWRDFIGYVPSEYEAYLWTHIVIGWVYAGDVYGVPASWYSTILTIANQLQSYIDNNATVWQEASQYELHGINLAAAGYSPSVYQNIIWIEYAPSFGSIKVKKCDDDTQACTPQGDGSLSGITFGVYDQSGNTLVTSGTTDSSGEITFSNLPVGTYLVKETATNSTYNLTASSQTTTISKNGQTRTLTFYDSIKKGKLTIYKNDKELGSCNKLGSASFAGNQFSITNNSTNSIYYGGSTIAKGAVVTTATMSASDCSVTINNLPYGDYIISETAAGNGYILNGSTQSFTIPTDNSYNISKTFTNQVKRGDVKFVKKDENSNSVMANIPFRITSTTTGESHIVVTSANGVVDTSANPHSQNTNGYDGYNSNQLWDVTNQNYGTWFGINAAVNDSLGALPYDTYKIEEINCDSNKFCYNIDAEEKTFTISENGVTVDLGTWNNDCAVFSLGTTATDTTDGDHIIDANLEGSKIKDTINYCAKIGEAFTITGVLIDKSTQEVLLVNGEPVPAQSINVTTPASGCGVATMIFDIDVSQLAGKEIVVFESLYYGDELIVEHKDINDESQTIYVFSVETLATDDADGDHIIPANETTRMRDIIDYCLKAGETYTIKSIVMNTKNGLPLTIDDQKVQTSIELTPQTNCSYVEVYFDIDASELEGAQVVMFEEVYDTENNLILEHNDLHDQRETFSILSLETTATDATDGDKNLVADNTASIKDVIDYCLIEDETFTIEGILMDKKTKSTLVINGAPVKQSITITPEERCGKTEMVFNFDATGLGGTEIVVFESLFYDGDKVLAHEDIDDEAQAVFVMVPAPDTGFITNTIISNQGCHTDTIKPIVLIAIIATSSYVIYRRLSGKRLFRRSKVDFK